MFVEVLLDSVSSDYCKTPEIEPAVRAAAQSPAVGLPSLPRSTDSFFCPRYD